MLFLFFFELVLGILKLRDKNIFGMYLFYVDVYGFVFFKIYIFNGLKESVLGEDFLVLKRFDMMVRILD